MKVGGFPERVRLSDRRSAFFYTDGSVAISEENKGACNDLGTTLNAEELDALRRHLGYWDRPRIPRWRVDVMYHLKRPVQIIYDDGTTTEIPPRLVWEE